MNNSSVICIDAGLVIRLVAEPDDRPVHEQWALWRAERREYVAPTLLYYEVANGIYRYVRSGMMPEIAGRAACEAALALPVRLIGTIDLDRRAWHLATRFALPATYDAHYLAVAESLGVHLYTVDQRLHTAVTSGLSWVHLVGAATRS